MKKIILKQNKACPLQNAIRGFTIIETMISISLFLVIVMAGMGALLNASSLHNKAQKMRSIMDNLSFIMEDMSRNLRTGYSYYCITGNDTLSNVSTTKSDQGCWGIAFESATGDPLKTDDQWVYYIGPDVNNNNKIGIFKATKGPYNIADNFTKLTPDEVVIDPPPASGFSVLGAEPSPDTQQPFVTIRLVGTITDRGTTTPFSLETSVSQRLIDR